MALDIYSTRAQLKAIEVMPPEYSFLWDTFGRDAGVVEDDRAIYDYMKGTRPMAPVVHPGTGGVLMARNGYETREIGFCTIAPERLIDAKDLRGRAFGEDILGAMTPEQREKKMMARDLLELRKAIQRRREWMMRQVLLTGKMEVFAYTNEGRDKKTTKVADYGFTNNFTPDTKWGTVGADISGDMEEVYDLVAEGGGNVDIMVMAPDVVATMKADEKFMKNFTYLNAHIGEINQRYMGAGVRYIGTNEDGVDYYSFAGKFVDDDGLLKPCMPSGTFIAGSRGMLRCIHGPVTQVEETGPNARHKTYIKREVPLRQGSVDGNAIVQRLTSCPTIVPDNIDGWAVGHVL